MTQEIETIKVNIHCDRKPNIKRSLFGIITLNTPICIGILTGSTAMQWMGFLATILCVAGITATALIRDYGLSISEARKRLDELDRENKGK